MVREELPVCEPFCHGVKLLLESRQLVHCHLLQWDRLQVRHPLTLVKQPSCIRQEGIADSWVIIAMMSMSAPCEGTHARTSRTQ